MGDYVIINGDLFGRLQKHKDILYSIGEICELLGIENFNLRYIKN